MQLFGASLGWVVFLCWSICRSPWHANGDVGQLWCCCSWDLPLYAHCCGSKLQAGSLQNQGGQWPTTKQIWRFHQPWQVAISIKVPQKIWFSQLSCVIPDDSWVQAPIAPWVLPVAWPFGFWKTVRSWIHGPAFEKTTLDEATGGWRMPSLLSIPMYPMKSQGK